ncbi:MAG: ABC transporter ATP-binding protein, partial [Acholeplasmataceae bacterium]|nr:ABC transporter ATP-binding protein [Acholeplasmataceae bacterium]
MIKIFKYLGKKGWVLFIISVLFIIVEVYLQLEIPTYMQNITKLLQSERSSLSEIWENGWMMLGYAGLTFLAAVITTFFSSYVGSILSRNLRSKVFDSVQSFSMEEMNKFSTPSLITRTTNDVMQVQMFFGMGLNSLIKAPTMIILAYLKMRSKAWQFSVATIVTLLFILISIAIIFILVVPKFKLMQEKIDNINKYSRENLNGLKVVRAFNAEEFQTARFENANKELTDINLYTNRVMSFMNPAIQSAMNFLSIAIYIIGAWLIYNIGPGVDEAIMLQKGLVFSESVVFLNYSMQIIASIMMLVFVLIMFPRASVAANRILEVANTKSSIFDGVGGLTETSTGTISFKNVSFKYPDAEGKVLDNISFDVNPG